jgi:hypothetical protein
MPVRNPYPAAAAVGLPGHLAPVIVKVQDGSLEMCPAEAAYINQIVRRFYGADAIIRNYGPDPKRLHLHVETTKDPGMEQHERLGVLMCDLVREQISLEVTKRGMRIRGNAGRDPGLRVP